MFKLFSIIILKRLLILMVLYLWVIPLYPQEKDTIKPIQQYTLKELSDITILTGSIQAESIEYAPSNITVITRQTIEDRAYRTLVDVCQDVPGFDFLSFNDGGGEYPTFNLHRGLGDIGNSEILIMVDGIVQNQISYNWSLLWTFESMFIDIEQIEIIQGPGSAVYGAQAFSGVINIITRKNFKGVKAKSFIGSGNTKGMEVFLGNRHSKDFNYSFAFHNYYSDGDMGKDRYDPGGYFSNNLYPSTIVADYDSIGNYVLNTENPIGGKLINNGFNTRNQNYTLRANIEYKNTCLSFFLSDSKRGYASEVVAYEYDLTSKEASSHYQSYHFNLKNSKKLNDKIELISDGVFRATHILPDGGFIYLYQFPGLVKTYSSYSYQGYIEEKLKYILTSKDQFYLGIKSIYSRKSERIIGLDGKLITKFKTNSSWDIAVNGQGLYQEKQYPNFNIYENAIYLLWDRQWSKIVSSSLGVRYDNSSEFGNIFNPRLAVDYNPNRNLGIKYLFGTAFRQPTIFELTNEFRGNPSLEPQKIRTHEIELNKKLFDYSTKLKINIFYSAIKNSIDRVADSTMLSGERFENVGDLSVGGLAFSINVALTKQIKVYSNYSILSGIENTPSLSFYEVSHVARHKINSGANFTLYKNKLVTDIRMNYSGKRKAPITNTWLQTFENGYAPDYLKFNASFKYSFTYNISLQFVINNIFNAQYYGIGRESGSSFIGDYDYQSNVNPTGLLPPYHPQPGRTYLFNLILNLNSDDQ
jgi:outer membrane receptor for ferrienterochelin and colicin